MKNMVRRIFIFLTQHANVITKITKQKSFRAVFFLKYEYNINSKTLQL
jgi:hypothetical protein